MEQIKTYFKRIFLLLSVVSVLGLGFFWSVEKAQAATYYVCNSGPDCMAGNPTGGWANGDDTRNKAQTQLRTTPWKTIQKCATEMQAGDSCIVGNGTYSSLSSVSSEGFTGNVVIRKSGESGKMITFKSENKWGATLYGGTYGFYLAQPVSYIRIEDFEITSDPSQRSWTGITSSQNCSAKWDCGNRPQTHDIEIIRNHIHHYGGFETSQAHAIAGIFVGAATYNWTIDQNLMHDLFKSPSSTEPNGTPYRMSRDHAIYINGRTMHGGSSHHLTVTNNIMYRVGGGILAIMCDDCVFAHNTMAYTVGNAYGTLHILDLVGWDCDASFIEQCKGPAPHSTCSACGGPRKNVFIENNIFYNPSATTPSFWIAGTMQGVRIRNNIIYSPKQLLESSQEQYGWSSVNFSNNYCTSALGNACQFPQPEPGSLFTDASKDSFTLKEGSLAINNGIILAAPLYDFENKSRNDGKPDIGAYEYVNPTDVNSDGKVNIKDIQACINVITKSDLTYETNCQKVALPDTITNIKDIQEIIKAIIAN